MTIQFRPRRPLPRLEPDERKVVEAIAFVVAEAERRGVPVTQYDIVKTLFFADKAHLNEFGRPVTFDNYVAMRHGPVPSLAYDLLKGRTNDLHRFVVDRLPWSWRHAPEIGATARVFYGAKPEWDDEVLSPSDVSALQNALTLVKTLSFNQIRRLTHDDPAYVEAWGMGESANAQMSYGLLFENPDDERAEVVKCLSENRAAFDR